MRTKLASLLFLFSLSGAPAAHVWVEGESGTAENISPNGWYLSVREGDLSGGKWLASYGGQDDPLARFKVTIPEKSTYAMWVRANPVQAVMHVKVGDGEWLEVPISSEKHDTMNIASDGKPDMRFLAWSKAGDLELDAGDTAITFRMSSPNGRHGAIDCFCLNSDLSWRPQKTFRPGEATTWPAPELTQDNLRKWGDFIHPSEDDLAWRKVRWHRHLDEACAEARELGRPVLLWAMNGHPCGET